MLDLLDREKQETVLDLLDQALSEANFFSFYLWGYQKSDYPQRVFTTPNPKKFSPAAGLSKKNIFFTSEDDPGIIKFTDAPPLRSLF